MLSADTRSGPLMKLLFVLANQARRFVGVPFIVIVPERFIAGTNGAGANFRAIAL